MDPYLYSHSSVLKNLADIKDEKVLKDMEADYTSMRIAKIVALGDETIFSSDSFKKMHKYIFQDVYDWAGKYRTINMEKEEPALGGLSVEYTDHKRISKEVTEILDKMNSTPWKTMSRKEVVQEFSKDLATFWKIHPFREGNTRTVITFCCQLIESKGVAINRDLFKDNPSYTRTALVAASAIFLSDIGDRRNLSYLERIVEDALKK